MIKLEIEDFMANSSDQIRIRSQTLYLDNTWILDHNYQHFSQHNNYITVVTSSEKLSECFIVRFPIKVSGEIEIIVN